MSTQTSKKPPHPSPAATTDLKLEVVVIPVSDVDRAGASTRALAGAGHRFRERSGFRARPDDTSRLAVLHHFGKGTHSAVPGSVQRTVPGRR